MTDSWATLREILSPQRRVTVTFSQRDGRSLQVHKATVTEAELMAPSRVEHQYRTRRQQKTDQLNQE